MLRAGHILCKVDDIHAAVRDFEELGFTMAWGGAPDWAHNALLWFESGPFIELFELPARFGLLRHPFALRHGRAAGERLARWARPGEGWRDLALETDDTELDGVRAELRAWGVTVSRVMKGARTRPDGDRVRYQFLAPSPSCLPFVVSAYDPPQRPEKVLHPNGARGVARIGMAVAAADRTAYDALVGSDDPWIDARPSGRTGVRRVELHGLEDALDPVKLHGAWLAPARRD
ncbi:hypothetical protein GCM10010441_27510 [Kitasatospora paracochleata]|uniref:Glyoxalase-like domain-containing protein n=1 Tax=Kitasatospora paracochleata TaxID=58354 RepID=A0ABT1IWM3_9ACTN|nr:VOC family protein [Kitasatospora paracochleata]MCP2309469.1 hypothetical protein [Kitasatospora paracochleata]